MIFFRLLNPAFSTKTYHGYSKLKLLTEAILSTVLSQSRINTLSSLILLHDADFI